MVYANDARFWGRSDDETVRNAVYYAAEAGIEKSHRCACAHRWLKKFCCIRPSRKGLGECFLLKKRHCVCGAGRYCIICLYYI